MHKQDKQSIMQDALADAEDARNCILGSEHEYAMGGSEWVHGVREAREKLRSALKRLNSIYIPETELAP